MKKISWKNCVGLWKWNWNRTPQSAQNLFSRKSNLKLCIIFNILFANAQGSVISKYQTSMFKALVINQLLWLKILGDKYFIFCKSRCSKYSLEIKLFIMVPRQLPLGWLPTGLTPRQLPRRYLPPRNIAHQIFAPWMIAPGLLLLDNYSKDNCHLTLSRGNCLREKLPFGCLSPT